MINITREHCPADRYKYDFDVCSYAKGFCQIDTEQDDWYYGQWANPTTFTIFSYCEGDCTTTQCDTAEEFTDRITRLEEWSRANGYTCRIDPGIDDTGTNTRIWTALGLAHMLH